MPTACTCTVDAVYPWASATVSTQDRAIAGRVHGLRPTHEDLRMKVDRQHVRVPHRGVGGQGPQPRAGPARDDCRRRASCNTARSSATWCSSPCRSSRRGRTCYLHRGGGQRCAAPEKGAGHRRGLLLQPAAAVLRRLRRRRRRRERCRSPTSARSSRAAFEMRLVGRDVAPAGRHRRAGHCLGTAQPTARACPRHRPVSTSTRCSSRVSDPGCSPPHSGAWPSYVATAAPRSRSPR